MFTDKKAKKLIEQLLSHNPESRLDGSFSRLKNHSWFEGINWANIHEDSPAGHIPYKPLQKLNMLKRWKSSDGKPLKKHVIVDFDDYNDEGFRVNKDKWKNFGTYIDWNLLSLSISIQSVWVSHFLNLLISTAVLQAFISSKVKLLWNGVLVSLLFQFFNINF